jgi:hypothetical protein
MGELGTSTLADRRTGPASMEAFRNVCVSEVAGITGYVAVAEAAEGLEYYTWGRTCVYVAGAADDEGTAQHAANRVLAVPQRFHLDANATETPSLPTR